MAQVVRERTYDVLRPVYLYFLSQNRGLEPTSPPRSNLLAKLEPFKSLIYDTPPDHKLTQADILPLLDQMSEIVKNWSDNVINILLDLLPQEQKVAKRTTKGGKRGSKGKGKASALDPAVLDRATAIFACNRCPSSQTELLLFPQVVSHWCLINGNEKVPKEDQWDPNCWWVECHDTQVEFDEVAPECARAIIKALGKDPKTTTWKELDEANQRVECLSCRRTSVWSWTGVMQYVPSSSVIPYVYLFPFPLDLA